MEPRDLSAEAGLLDLLGRARARCWDVARDGGGAVELMRGEREAWLDLLGRPTTLDAAELADLERELDGPLPEALRVVLAARVPALAFGWGVTVEAVPEYANQAWSAFRIERGLVAFGEGRVEDLRATFVTARLGDDSPDPELFLFDCSPPAFPAVARTRLAAWARQRVEAVVGALDADPGRERPGLAPLVPRLVPPEAPPAERVWHPRFGGGRVVERRGDRVLVAFDDGSRRRILAGRLRPEGS